MFCFIPHILDLKSVCARTHAHSCVCIQVGSFLEKENVFVQKLKLGIFIYSAFVNFFECQILMTKEGKITPRIGILR